MDSSKVREELGIDPLGWEQAVRRTVRWIVDDGLVVGGYRAQRPAAQRRHHPLDVGTPAATGGTGARGRGGRSPRRPGSRPRGGRSARDRCSKRWMQGRYGRASMPARSSAGDDAVAVGGRSAAGRCRRTSCAAPRRGRRAEDQVVAVARAGLRAPRADRRSPYSRPPGRGRRASRQGARAGRCRAPPGHR